MHTESAYVMMVAGAKGGTGKSVVASLLGFALAQRGLKVLLIELTTGSRSVDFPCGVHGKVVYDLGDVFAQRCDVHKAITQSASNANFHVLCAQRGGGAIKPALFYSLMQSVINNYSIIIIDVESGFGVPLKSACVVSNGAIIVTTPDTVALNANSALSDVLFAHTHITTKLFINRVPENLSVCGTRDLDECIDTVGAQLIGVLPQSDIIIKASCSGAQPPENTVEACVFKAVAARICGIHAPLVFK